MIEYFLSNPLTVEEKLQVTRLIEHDSTVYFAILQNIPVGSVDIDKEKYHAIVEHVGNIQQTIELLTQGQEVWLLDNFNLTKLDKVSTKRITDKIGKVLLKGSLDSHVGDIKPMLSVRPLMYSALTNLIKNGVEAQLGTKDYNTPIGLTVDSYQGFPENALFIPQGAKGYKNFVVFNVHNKGKSFPKDVPLDSYFSRKATEKGGGFGLYFVKLAAKFLKAPLNIISKQGDTTLSFYHPVYLELDGN